MSLSSTFAIFEEDRMRLDKAKTNKHTFICLGYVLDFHYLWIRQEAARQCQILKNVVSQICYCARLSLSLKKIGGGSAMPNSEKHSFSNLSLHSTFAIFEEDRRRLGNAHTNKHTFLCLGYVLAFHYLWIRQDAARQCQILKNIVSQICHCTRLSLYLL